MSQLPTHDLIVIGGGAAGFFGAIQAGRQTTDDASIVILESSRRVLNKVKISGGGRCNVTHECYDPKQMAAKHYPEGRGQQELIGPFFRFGVIQTIAWFYDEGVELKTEDDGRIFPTTDDSQTIIDTLTSAASDVGVEVRTGTTVTDIEPLDEGFGLQLRDGSELRARRLLLATGGTRLSKSEALPRKLDHTMVPAVASLFTFDIDDQRLSDLQGVSVGYATASLSDHPLEASGPLLITHRGLSGPGILELSSRGARLLHDDDYQFELHVDWLPHRSADERLAEMRHEAGARQIRTRSPFPEIPKRLWARLVDAAGVADNCRWASLPADQRRRLIDQLHNATFRVTGKSTHKEEFVTCGGIDTDEFDMTTMQSRLHPHLYAAGEVLNIDGITGGFNFQNAWTTGYLAGSHIAQSLN